MAVAYRGKVYVWGGRIENLSEKDDLISVVEEFDPVQMKWTQLHAKGDFPQWPERCTHAFSEDRGQLYVYGGYHGSFSNSLYMLTLGSMEWKEISGGDPENAPGKKADAGMVIWKDLLVLFGGYGCPPQRKHNGAKYECNGTREEFWTNDLYTFEAQSSMSTNVCHTYVYISDVLYGRILEVSALT